ncbi:MAG: tRNA (N(6)-L-threonylcarbamoyladenosine(37)-C(2))-methylthiotransferase MtaB [Lachnospiraceae bacterium]|nr:tRNA (N(6)-L-threonylcarbamoyladenosine(37)-C(2))-methylthiotransferase MtaB [Lachnospiraceae bacterium]
MRIAFLTLGCKVNSYETDKMKQQFIRTGNTVVSFDEEADVYMVNTCTVTNIADRKSRQMLHRAKKKNPAALIVATGCYVDSALARGEKDESVDLFVPNDKKDVIATLVKDFWQEKILQEQYECGGDSLSEECAGFSEQAKGESHTRAYVKVQNGCNLYCSYCIIPYVRGPLTSKPIADVITEVEQLAAKGVKEVVITGIHLSSYGVDDRKAGSFLELQGRPLLELLKEVNQVEGIERIRLGSLEPRIISEEFAGELSKCSKVCPHFHLSLQSGCDETLRRMNRHYTAAEYLDGVEVLRKYYDEPAITTDIIVGFPGETPEEFAKTCAFTERVGFSRIHVFKYSRRKGTVADGLENQITEAVKGERSDVLMEIEARLEETYCRQFLGTEETILVEEVTSIEERDYFVGYTTRYVRVAVPVGENAHIKPGEMVDVNLIKQTISGYLVGECTVS